MVKVSNEEILEEVLLFSGNCGLRDKCPVILKLRQKYDKLIEEFEKSCRSYYDCVGCDSDLIYELDRRRSLKRKELNEKFENEVSLASCCCEKKDFEEILENLRKNYDFKNGRIYVLAKEVLRVEVIKRRLLRRINVFLGKEDIYGNEINLLYDKYIKFSDQKLRLTQEMSTIRRKEKDDGSESFELGKMPKLFKTHLYFKRNIKRVLTKEELRA